MVHRIVLVVLVLILNSSGFHGFHYYEPPVNFIEGDPHSFVCPWYRNLARHVPMGEGTCDGNISPSKYKNCLSDDDCAPESFCCVAICQGITRCYNPSLNEFTDEIEANRTRKCAPQPAACAPVIVTVTVPTTTTTTAPTTTATTTESELPVTTATTTSPPTTTTEPPSTSTTTEPPTTTTTEPSITVTEPSTTTTKMQYGIPHGRSLPKPPRTTATAATTTIQAQIARPSTLPTFPPFDLSEFNRFRQFFSTQEPSNLVAIAEAGHDAAASYVGPRDEVPSKFGVRSWENEEDATEEESAAEPVSRLSKYGNIADFDFLAHPKSGWTAIAEADSQSAASYAGPMEFDFDQAEFPLSDLQSEDSIAASPELNEAEDEVMEEFATTATTSTTALPEPKTSTETSLNANIEEAQETSTVAAAVQISERTMKKPVKRDDEPTTEPPNATESAATEPTTVTTVESTTEHLTITEEPKTELPTTTEEPTTERPTKPEEVSTVATQESSTTAGEIASRTIKKPTKQVEDEEPVTPESPISESSSSLNEQEASVVDNSGSGSLKISKPYKWESSNVSSGFSLSSFQNSQSSAASLTEEERDSAKDPESTQEFASALDSNLGTGTGTSKGASSLDSGFFKEFSLPNTKFKMGDSFAKFKDQNSRSADNLFKPGSEFGSESASANQKSADASSSSLFKSFGSGSNAFNLELSNY